MPSFFLSKGLILFSLLLILFCGKAGAATLFFPESHTRVTLAAEIADTAEKRERGLMFRRGLPSGEALFFIFGQETKVGFWMYNVPFAIDIIFLDTRFVVTDIVHSASPCAKKPCPTYASSRPIAYAIETEAGFCKKYGVAPRQRIEYRP